MMTPKACLFFVVLILLFPQKVICQQTISPGGVKSPVVWYMTDSSANIPAYRSNGTDPSIQVIHAPPYQTLNFHPSMVFNGTSTLSVPLTDSSMSSSSFFTVYQSTRTEVENSIWHKMKEGQTSLVLTTKRVADLESTSYMNYNDVYPKNPKINIYVQQKIKETYYPVHQSWEIGYKPSSPALPVYAFTGLIPEFIAYKRVLSGTDRLKIASYLAIKYGITISDPNATYLNSSGDILWDGLNYTDYYHNITGIGRDDTSALVQPKSTSSNNPGLLTISASKMSNNNFLIWGDNDKALSIGKPVPGMPIILQKKWLMAAHTSGLPLVTEVVIDTKQIDASLPAKPIYWLAVDRTGIGDFPADGTDFIKMTTLDDKGFGHFANVQWGLKGNNKEVMGVFISDNVLATTKIINPVCSDPASGLLKIKITSGEPPYRIIVAKNNESSLLDNSFNTNDTITVNNISGGKYNLTVTDAYQQKFTTSFYINNSDGPAPLSVAASYRLPQVGPLTIRADSLMPPGITYTWTGPNGFQSMNGEVQITQPGLYCLTCNRDGCKYQQQITISPFLSGPFTSVRVFPNQSIGPYTADVSLDNPAPVHMAIYTITGTLVTSADGNGLAHYRFPGTLRMNGTYLIKFTSNGHTVTWRQIIVN